MYKYSLIKVGGFRVGDYSSKTAALKALKGLEAGFYQIIDHTINLAVWEGYKHYAQVK